MRLNPPPYTKTCADYPAPQPLPPPPPPPHPTATPPPPQQENVCRMCSGICICICLYMNIIMQTVPSSLHENMCRLCSPPRKASQVEILGNDIALVSPLPLPPSPFIWYAVAHANTLLAFGKPSSFSGRTNVNWPTTPKHQRTGEGETVREKREKHLCLVYKMHLAFFLNLGTRDLTVCSACFTVMFLYACHEMGIDCSSVSNFFVITSNNQVKQS